MSLDAVALLIIIGEIQKLQAEVGPLTFHSLTVQTSDVHHLLLQGQQTATVGTLKI